MNPIEIEEQVSLLAEAPFDAVEFAKNIPQSSRTLVDMIRLAGFYGLALRLKIAVR